MRKIVAAVLMIVVAAWAGPALARAGQEAPLPEGAIQPISWDAWLTVKAKAEEHDAAGNLVAALQYYLEYARQAGGLRSPVRVAWGKNNAAYMIIKMHRQDPTVDLAPARKLLEEGLSVTEATEECKRVMEMNLEHVRGCIRGRN